MWPNRIEALREFVLCECRDIPPDLVLAIIKHESAGIIGRPGNAKIRTPGTLYDTAGNPHKIDIALGLMQCIPAVVNGYNAGAPAGEKATLEDMTGDDERAARLQIRIGCNFLAASNHKLNNSFPEACPAQSLAAATDDQIAIVLTAYAVGPGATSKKLKKLAELGKKQSFANLKINFPDWGKNAEGEYVNNPLGYANVVLKWYRNNKQSSYKISKCGKLADRLQQLHPQAGGIAVVLLLAGAGYAINWYFTKRKKGTK